MTGLYFDWRLSPKEWSRHVGYNDIRDVQRMAEEEQAERKDSP